MAYVQIDGVRLEKELIDMAKAHTTGRGEGRLSRDEAVDLINSANDGQGITGVEMATLNYIRDNFDLTDAAVRVFDENLK
ncbi:hypothetical protein [Ferrimonas lipolytica]|uniref:Uncharacterized protein n=1 Tax=Ferrimonas lipolytica TaxID=2724191 RepID=A0A6H1UF05_9GAMM|nr:hypothetical protein [Ferrimonas lipolytica]QIZ77624.1 hypothetical protein HER31_12415 [Ferrimonas lipolytica]